MSNVISSINLNNIVGILSIPYATCETAAGTAAKVAALDSEFSLESGAQVRIKFTHENTATNPTLNVKSTGAKAIYWHGTALSNTQYWVAGSVLDFVYNGTQWDLVGVAKDNNDNTTYTFNGAVSTIKDNNLAANRALLSDTNGKVAVSAITSVELNYLDGVTSNIQEQLNNKSSSIDVEGKVNRSGDTFTGPVTFNSVDGSSINFDDGIYINKNGGNTLLGTNNDTAWVGMPNAALVFRGSANNPTYNDNNVALVSDIGNAVTSLKTNVLASKTLWVGTQAEYDALSSHPETTLYFITDSNGAVSGSGSSGGSSGSGTTDTATITSYISAHNSDAEAHADIRTLIANLNAAATTSEPGLMSASDKSKLDNITASADAVSFSRSLSTGVKIGTLTINGTATELYAPTATAGTSGSTVSFTQTQTSGTAIGTLTIDGSGTTLYAPSYAAATTSEPGLMSASDKSKLDNITASADAVSVSKAIMEGVTIATLTINGTANTLIAPIISGTSDLVAGVSILATGTIYCVYE